MKKVLIISGNRQPIPPIQGGAVENLAQMFIDSNECYNLFEIIVISCFPKAKIDVSNYKKVNYFFASEEFKTNKSLMYINLFLSKIFHKTFVFSSRYSKFVIDKIKKENISFDSIIVENYIEAVLPLRSAFPDKEIFLHLHNDKLNESVLNGKRIVKACNKIITVSDYIKTRVDSIKNASQKSVTLINSIEVSKFGTLESRKKGEALREKYNISNDEFLILFTGRIAKTKGVLELIKAFSMLTNLKSKLVIIGNSWYGKGMPNDKYMHELCKATNKIKDKIIFTGYVDYNRIQEYYSMADLVVIPSIWQEPCSLTLFETMASNVPLITTNTGGTVQIVKDYAIVLDVNKQFISNLSMEIEKAYENYKSMKKRAEAAFKYVQGFNPEHYYKEMAYIIEGEMNK